MEPIRLAFYGKGGIGKSTISANVSAALAQRGKRVLHIGCDPKADSTRCLTRRRIPTVLEQINTLGGQVTREDLVFPGIWGSSCIEAGGPQAGTGCAGMGITAMEEELERLGILEEDWDVIVYDVLGDVVCGGFSVPMRKRYVQKVYIVTSGDYMSLYAANNIMRGVRRYCDASHMLLGGLIQNHSRSAEDDSIVRAYADCVQAGVCQRLPESREVKLADFQRAPVAALYPDSAAAAIFQELAEDILAQRPGTIPQPLEDEELETFCQRVFRLEAQGV